MVGGFHLHIADTMCFTASEFLNLIVSFNFKQHISGCTHLGGHTLDLVFTHGIDIENVDSKDLCVTDHKFVLFDICFLLESQPSCHMKCSSFIKETSAVSFSDSGIVLKDGFVDAFLRSFNNHCTSVPDKVAHLKF